MITTLFRRWALVAAAGFALSTPALGQTYPEPIAVPEWQFLQVEAVNVLVAQGYPAPLVTKYARDRIRAYVFSRLIDIVQIPAVQRTAQETAAFEKFRDAVKASRVATATNARKYWEAINAGDPCFSGGGGSTIYVPPSVIVSLLCKLFQDDKPNKREIYRGKGATETYAPLLSGNGSIQVAVFLRELDWFAAIAATTDGPLFAPDSDAEERYQKALNFFRQVRDDLKADFLVSLLKPDSSPEFVIQAVLVLATTVWDTADFAVIGNDLANELTAASAPQTVPDLLSAVNGPLTELALVFLGSVLDTVPPTLPPTQPSNRPCSFKADFVCQSWVIRESDPDFTAERYAGIARPNPEVGSYFAVKRDTAMSWQANANLAPPAADLSAVRPWAVPVEGDALNVNGELDGSSTRRQEPWPIGTETVNELRLPKTTGLSSFVANGLLVHTPVDAGVQKPDEWKYGTTLKYKNWLGQWWRADFVDGTFLHVRDSDELPGLAQVAGYIQFDGNIGGSQYNYCKGWDYNAFKADQCSTDCVYRDYGKVDGTCMVVSRNFDASKLKGNDRIEIGGQRRRIDAKYNCEGPRLDADPDGIPGTFLVHLYCNQDQPNYNQYNDWGPTAFRFSPPIASLITDVDGPSPWFTIRRLADVDTCGLVTTGLTQFSCGPVFNPNTYKRRDFANCPAFGTQMVGDSSLNPLFPADPMLNDSLWLNQYAKLDCFFSPLVRFQSTKSENWSALYLPPARAVDDTYTVTGPTLVVPYSNSVIMNDSIPGSASITNKSTYAVTLLQNVTRGTLGLNINGSFTYTRGVAAAGQFCPVGTPYCGPDSFTYQVCAIRDGRNDCATAAVNLNVINEAPEAFDVAFTQGAGKYIASYTYWDAEGDPEQGTTFKWFWTNTSFQPQQTITMINEFVIPANLQTLQKVEVTPKASRGSWPNLAAAYGSDQDWTIEYAINVACTPDYLAFPNGSTTCVYSPFTFRPYPLPIPYQLRLGTINLAYQFTPDDVCPLENSIPGFKQVGTQTCTRTFARNMMFTDSGGTISANVSMWINGYPGGTMVLSRPKNFSRTNPSASFLITTQLNPANGGSLGCTPNPVTAGGSTTCTAVPNAGWTFTGWTDQLCMPFLGPVCVQQQVNSARTVVATFAPTIISSAVPAIGGDVICTPNPIHASGNSVCTATPAGSYAFGSWSGDCSGTDTQCTVPMVSSPKAVTANFFEVYPSIDGTKTLVPRTQVAATNGWQMASPTDPNHPTRGWVALLGNPYSPASPPPPGVSLIYPLVLDFVLDAGTPGSTATVTITYPFTLPPGSKYWKYNRGTDTWYELNAAAYSILDNVVTLTLTDGGTGDNDGVVNGLIVDPGGPAITPGALDVDANGQYDAMTDGLIIIRYMLGLTGTPMVNSVGHGATRSNPAVIKAYLDSIKLNEMLDVDADGLTDPFSDGLIILRYLFGLRGDGLINGAVSTASKRGSFEIETHLQFLTP